jgi:hypothetical protein
MIGFGDYGFVEWTPRCEPREPEDDELPQAEVTAVILRALLPFREAREAVVRALREAEAMWSVYRGGPGHGAGTPTWPPGLPNPT